MKLVKILLAIVAVGAIFIPQEVFAQEQLKVNFYTARILNVEKKVETIPVGDFQDDPMGMAGPVEMESLLIKLKVLSGDKKGQDLEIKWASSGSPREPKLEKNQKIIIGCSPIEDREVCNIGGYDRFWSIIALFVLLLAIALIVAGKKAINAAATLILSLIIVIFVMIPLVLKGYSPFYLALIGGGLILLPSVYLAHGFKMRSHIALVSLLTMVIMVALLSLFFASRFKLLGFTGEEAMYLNQNINLYAIMIGGLILATIGVLDDVVITQISVVEELFYANSNLKTRGLFFRAMKIGRDHIYTVVNTLFLVYAGVSLPTLILIQQNNVPLMYAVQNEGLATEIVRTGVGTMGLILALPLATYLTCYIITRKPELFEPHTGHSHGH